MSEEIHQTYISNMLHFTKTPHRTNFGNQQLHKRHLNGNSYWNHRYETTISSPYSTTQNMDQIYIGIAEYINIFNFKSK